MKYLVSIRRKQSDNQSLYPDDWPGFEITYRYGDSKYRIEVKNPQKVQQGVKSIILDGRQLDASFIPLTDDGKPHHIVVTMGTEH